MTRAIVVNKVITNYATGTPILHIEASFISTERGLRWWILSQTSLKHYIHFSFILKLMIFICKQLKGPVAFSVVHFDIKSQIVIFTLNLFSHESFCSQRVLVTPAWNLFSHWSQNQSRWSAKKEDLTAVNLCTDLNDHASTQVEFSFKGFYGDHETPRDILGWCRNMERALIGLDHTAGSNQHNMCKQFMRGSTLSSFKSAAMVILVNKKANAFVHAKTALNNHPAHRAAGHDPTV